MQQRIIFLSGVFLFFLCNPAVSFGASPGPAAECEQADREIQTFHPSKPWSFNIAVGTQYDSNVVLNPDGNPLPQGISRKADWREVADINAGYTIIRNERVQWTVGYNIYQSFQNALSDFNVTSQRVDTTGLVSATPYLKVGLKYYFEYVLIGGDNFNQAHSVAPAMVVSPWKRFPTVIEYRYRDNDYKDTDNFGGNAERSGSNKMVGLTQHIPILPTLKTYLGFSQDEDDTQRSYLNYRGRKGKAEIHYDLPKNVLMTVKAEVYKRDFKGADPELGKKRKDKFYAVDVVFSKKIFKKLGLTMNLGYFYSRNSSNADAFDFSRSVTSLFLNRSF